MCWPSCRGGAYLAVSVFIYRSVCVIIAMLSSSITRLKSLYVPISLMEELLLQLIYFIPLFTSASFIFIGLEGNSFTFVLYSTLTLGGTLFIRYGSELCFIYAVNWEGYRLKTPSLYLNMTFDLLLLLTLFLYANNRLRKLPWASSKEMYRPSSAPDYSNLLEEQQNKNVAPPAKTIDVENEVVAGTPLERIHHPFSVTSGVERERLNRPLPPDPEFDDISLPPTLPRASPDYEDF